MSRTSGVLWLRADGEEFTKVHRVQAPYSSAPVTHCGQDVPSGAEAKRRRVFYLRPSDLVGTPAESLCKVCELRDG